MERLDSPVPAWGRDIGSRGRRQHAYFCVSTHTLVCVTCRVPQGYPNLHLAICLHLHYPFCRRMSLPLALLVSWFLAFTANLAWKFPNLATRWVPCHSLLHVSALPFSMRGWFYSFWKALNGLAELSSLYDWCEAKTLHFPCRWQQSQWVILTSKDSLSWHTYCSFFLCSWAQAVLWLRRAVAHSPGRDL